MRFLGEKRLNETDKIKHDNDNILLRLINVLFLALNVTLTWHDCFILGLQLRT